MKIIHGVSVIFLIIVLLSVSEGKNLPESQEIIESKGKLLAILFGEPSGTPPSDNPRNNYCKCKKHCQCCYNISNFSVCTSSRVIRLVNEEHDLAIQGTLIINNGPVFTCSIKLKNVPKVCYRNDQFAVCLTIAYDVVADNQLKVCGQMNTSYSSTSINLDLFCQTFEVIRQENYYAVKEAETIKNSLISSLGFETHMFQ